MTTANKVWTSEGRRTAAQLRSDIDLEPGVDVPALAGGVTPVAQLGSGSPDGTKFLRGDGAWATPVASAGALPSSKHVITENHTIPAGESAHVTRYLEIASGITLEIGADADLEIG